MVFISNSNSFLFFQGHTTDMTARNPALTKKTELISRSNTAPDPCLDSNLLTLVA